MSGVENGPKDPREGRRPKDSEFYQIPPDLKKEFDLLMTEREKGGAAVESIAKAVQRRKKLSRASLIFGVLGGALVVVGPVLAIVFSLMARGAGKNVEGMPETELEGAKFGLILGILMLIVNAVTIYFLFPR
ncbi:MAG: hypothetical protein ACYS47_06785 [Planctomycetota bacterium]|jgi:hypothetical protein